MGSCLHRLEHKTAACTGKNDLERANKLEKRVKQQIDMNRPDRKTGKYNKS
jgi:hypothetical protein